MLNKTLFELVNDCPEILDYLMANDLIKNTALIDTIGKQITLGSIIKTKKLDENKVLSDLQKIVDKKAKNENDVLIVRGILPCPVRMQLSEGLEKVSENLSVNTDLRAASQGIDWLLEDLKGENKPDVLISAGYDLLFDREIMTPLNEQKYFSNQAEYDHYQKTFENMYDTNGNYTFLSVVPAIFVINEDLLAGRKMPTSWEEVLSDSFENSISLPVGDFDLFNSLLLSIDQLFGEEGLRKLSRNMISNMHPSEMLLSTRKKVQPVISIMPFFFSKMAKKPMVPVWPKEGAITSPIFMLTKDEKKEELKPIVDFFTGEECAKIFSHQGKFPSVHPDVDNYIPDKKFLFLGWDYLKNNDMKAEIQRVRKVFGI